MTAGVAITRVSRHYGGAKALDDVSLDIAAGEYIVLLGPSGCGKTTLLNLIGGFDAPDTGLIAIGGRSMAGVAPKDRPTTTVFQDYALFPHMTLAQNVAFGLRMRGVARGPRLARAAEMLALVGLTGAGNRRPHELSGGQRQRVALARALAVDPDVLLLDEPLGALDLKLRRGMQDELKAIQRRVGTTFVHVTHDQEEAMAIADRIVVMNAGRIEDLGPPRSVYLRPRSLFSASFMGEVNRIPLTADLPFAAHLGGQKGTLCIRPESIVTEPGGTAEGSLGLGPCRIEEITFFGTHQRAMMRVDAAPDQRLTIHLPQNVVAAPGQTLTLFAHDYVILEA